MASARNKEFTLLGWGCKSLNLQGVGEKKRTVEAVQERA